MVKYLPVSLGNGLQLITANWKGNEGGRDVLLFLTLSIMSLHTIVFD